MKLRLFIFFIVLFFNSVRYYSEQSVVSVSQSLSITLLVSIIPIFLFFTKKEKYNMLNKNFLRSSVIFIVGFIIVHLFEDLAYVLGIHDNIIGSEFVSTETIKKAGILSSCFITVFIAGYELDVNIKRTGVKNNYIGIKLEYLFCFFTVVFFLTMPSAYFRGQYGYFSNSNSVPLVTYMAQVFLQSSIVAIAVDRIVKYRNLNSVTLKEYIKSFSIFTTIPFVIYCVAINMAGDRGPSLYLSLVLILPYFIANNKKINFAKFAVIISIFALFLSILGTFRGMDEKTKSLAGAYNARKERYSDENIIFTSTSDLSDVVRAYHVLYEYSDEISHTFGLVFIHNALGIIPGLRPLLYSIIGLDEKTFLPGTLSTRLLGKDHGMGSSCLAELYMDFGFWGAIIMGFLFGMFFKYMDMILFVRIPIRSTLIMCFAVLCFAESIYLPRSNFFAPLNNSLYAFLFLSLFRYSAKSK